MTQTAQIEDSVDFSQQMINRNPVLQPKFIEQLLLQPALLSYHPPVPQPI